MTADLELWKLVIAAIVTLFGKWAWDRWISQSSRVTKEQCMTTQKLCREALLRSLETHTTKLSEGTECFDNLEHHQTRTDDKLMVILLTLLRICDHAGINCDDLTKEMVHREILR